MRFRALVVAAIFAALMPVSASAQTNEVVVTVFEGVGNVCLAAGHACTLDPADVLWNKTTNTAMDNGFYWPSVGPRTLRSPVLLNASGGPEGAPNNMCVSTSGGPGCQIDITSPNYTTDPSYGVFPSVVGVGAYCGSSYGKVFISFVSAEGFTQAFNAEWQQSAATVLPTVGTSTDGLYKLVGFSSSRGLSGSGNCGVTQATTGFQVEGWSVSFPA